MGGQSSIFRQVCLPSWFLHSKGYNAGQANPIPHSSSNKIFPAKVASSSSGPAATKTAHTRVRCSPQPGCSKQFATESKTTPPHPPLHPEHCLPMDFEAPTESFMVLGTSQKNRLRMETQPPPSAQFGSSTPIINPKHT